MTDSTIIYTHTDEAPALATYSFLPVIQAYASTARAASPSRPATSPWPGGSSPPSPSASRPDQRIERRPGRARGAGRAPRGQHHQAAQHLGLDPAAQGGRSPSCRHQGYALPDYPDDPKTDEERDVAGPLRQGHGQRGQPGAARGQLRPARAGLGQELRQGAPAPDGRMVARLEDQRRPHGRRRLPLDRAVRRHRRGRLAAHRAGRGATARSTVLRESVPVLAGEVVDASVMRVAALREFLDGADRPGQGRGRALLGAPQGHDDEGLRPDHLRPRRCAPSSRRPSPATATTLAAAGLSPNDGLGAILTGLELAARRRRDQGLLRRRAGRRARRWPWSTPTAASPTCTCRATSSSTPRCRP